ncbi:hypothetical protein K9N50_10000 [bacterium]|nr:hypothetical protein [bacterium]
MRLKIATIVVLALILLITIDCSFEIPGAPIWTIDVVLPFSQRTYRLAELVVDSMQLKKDTYGVLFGADNEQLQFEYWDSLDYQLIGNRLKYSSSDTGDYDNAMEKVRIRDAKYDSTVIMVRSVCLDSVGPVEAFDLPLITDNLHFDDFVWAQVSHGWIDFIIDNGFSFPVESITVSLENVNDDSLLGNMTYSQLIPGKSVRQFRMPVIRNLFGNDFKLSITGRIIGTYRDILIPADEKLTIVTCVNELYADSAYAIVREQVFSQEDTLEYDDPNKLVTAIIDSGWAYFELWNTCPSEVIVDTYFLNVTDENGDTVVSAITTGPSLANTASYTLDSTDLRGTSVNMSLTDQSLRILAIAASKDTDPLYYYINGTQGVSGRYWTGELVYSDFVGLLDSVEVELSTRELIVDIPDNVNDLKNNITFEENRITLDTFNETTSPVLLDVGLYAACEDRDTTLYIFDIIAPGVDSIKFKLNFIPDRIRYDGEAKMGARYLPGFDNIISLNKYQGIRVDTRVQSELKISVNESSMKSDPTFLEDALDMTIEGLDLNVTLTNSIPVGGILKLLAGPDTTNMDTIMQAEIPVGIIIDHRAEAVTESYVITLEKEKIDIITQPNVYIQQLIELQSTEGDTVWLYGADSLDVNAYAEIRYLVDPGENNE